METGERSDGGKIQSLEQELRQQISNLKSLIESAGHSSTSVSCEKSVEEYKRDRELLLKTLTQVPGPRPTCVDWKIQEEELKASQSAEYNRESLPFLLHEFFCDRVSYLIHLKHLLLVRWARFSSQPSVVASLYQDFQDLMRFITLEYDDALSRCQRLSESVNCLLANKPSLARTVDREDIFIYLRWLVSHFHCTKKLSACVEAVKWVPHLHFRKLLSTCDGHHKDTAKVQGHQLFPQKVVEPSPNPTPHPTTQKASLTIEQISTSGVQCSSQLGRRGGGGGEGHIRRAGLFSEGTAGARPPQHTTDMSKLQPLFQHLLSCYGLGGSGGILGSGGELDLYYQVKQKFHSVFKHQERLSTYHGYETNIEDHELPSNTAKDPTGLKVFKKLANWQSFNTLRSGRHSNYVKAISHMKEKVKDHDMILELQMKCLQMSSENRTLYALKQHVVMVIQSEPVKPVSAVPHKSKKETFLIWKGIYQGLDARNPLDPLPDDDKPMPNDLDSNWEGTGKETSNIFMTAVPGQEKSIPTSTVTVPTTTASDGLPSNLYTHHHTSHKPVGTFTIPSALRLMSSEEGRQVSTKALSAPKNAFFAFVLVRHLHIRDLSRKCLSVLNYFQSVERTLVINCAGLSLDAEGKSHKSTYHSYAHLYRTPADYKVKEADFIRFKSVENHDDYYSSEDGLHQVFDVKGTWIVYDVSLEDFKSLQDELLYVGSYYIQKSYKPAKGGGNNAEPVSFRCVDRFAVLLDLWICEEQYQQNKKKLVDCYLEAYHLTPDPKEKQNLAQVIYDIISSRPRYDLDAPYFTECYHRESEILCTHTDFISSVLSTHISDCRSYGQLLVTGDSGAGGRGNGCFGMPLPLIAKQQVALAGSRSDVCPAYLLEVCPSVSMAAQLYHALRDTVEEAVHLCSLSPKMSKVKELSVELTVLQLTLEEGHQLTHLGGSYTADVQKKVFCEAFVEHPRFMSDLCKRAIQDAASDEDLTASEQQVRMVETGCNCLELVLLRHRLVLAAQKMETQIRVYKSQLLSFNEDTYHAHVRLVPFDHSAKLAISKDLDKVMELSLSEKQDEANLDRFTPVENCLSIQELSTDVLSNISFQTSGDMAKILTSRGMGNMRIALTAQVSMCHCLSSAVQYHSALLAVLSDSAHHSEANTRSIHVPSSRTDLAQSSTVSIPSQRGGEGVGTHSLPAWKKGMLSGFVSLQRCKLPLRDFMLGLYTDKPLSAIRSQEEAERIQRELVVDYCFNLLAVFSHFSLKTQLIHNYTKLSSLLTHYPAVRDVYFHFGKLKPPPSNTTPLSEETDTPPTISLISEPRQSRSRPPSLISTDGKQITNLWYIPHITEITKLCSQLTPTSRAGEVLTMLAEISTTFLQIVMTFCANAQLGSQKGFHSNRPGAEWGGLEGVGNELSNLSNEISRLDRPNDPSHVLKYLKGKSQIQYWCYYFVVGLSLPQTFLSKKSLTSYSMVRHHAVAFLEKMANIPLGGCIVSGLSVSETLLALHTDSKVSASWFPWQWFLRHSQILDPDSKWKSCSSERGTHAMLALFPKEDRLAAQGEIIAISAQIEEILLSHYYQQKRLPGNSRESSTHRDHSREHDWSSSMLSISGAITRGLKLPNNASPGSSFRKTNPKSGPLNLLASASNSSISSLQSSSRTQPKSGWMLLSPLVAMEHVLKYLKMAAVVEVGKWAWSSRVLGSALPKGCAKDYKELKLMQKMWKKNVDQQVMKQSTSHTLDDAISVSQTMDMDSTSVGLVESEDLQLSEFQLLKAQHSRLLDLLESQLVSEQIKYVIRLQNFVILESEQEEDVLPLSAWKKPSFKEPPVVLKGRCAEVFFNRFDSVVRDKGDQYTITKQDWKALMVTLETLILSRERDIYETFSTFYEGMLNHLYISQHHREQELDHYKAVATSKVYQSREEAIVLLAEQTEELVLEITALRNRVRELEEELDASKDKSALQLHKDYQSLVSDVFSFSSAVKTRFEDYRQELYKDTLDALQDVRQQTATSVSKMRQRLGIISEENGKRAVLQSLVGEDSDLIQRENASLAKHFCKMHALTGWQQLQRDSDHKLTVKGMEEERCDLRTELTRQKVQSQEEILLLRQQVDVLRKSLFKSEKEVESLKKELADQKQKRFVMSKSFAKTQESSLVKTDPANETKIEQLMADLEKKDQTIKELTEQQERQVRCSESEQTKMKKVLKEAKKQISHERSLKIDAFHQFEDLFAKVCVYTRFFLSLHLRMCVCMRVYMCM
jgi:hypothetical protein